MDKREVMHEEDYLDETLERMRECLRDLRKVADHDSAMQVRERCRDRMTNVARDFRELHEAFGEVCDENGELKDKLEEDWEARYERVLEHISDLVRGIIDAEELRDLANDYAHGDRKVTIDARDPLLP